MAQKKKSPRSQPSSKRASKSGKNKRRSQPEPQQSSSEPQLHPAEQYIADVTAGRIAVSKHVRRAVERHLRDLERTDLIFDREEACFAIQCFGFFRHSKGKWAGQPFTLSPWQQFILWCLFGWKRLDGTRRYRRAYIEIARKNGKSTFLAGILLILLLFDGEPGAEIYSAATKKEQARIVFNEAKRMVRASADLRELIRSYRNNLDVPETNSKFEPLSSDANSLDGLNIHGAGVDELHAHPTREVYDVLDTATGARTQPLIVAITTAGFNQEGICFEIRGYCIDVLDPGVDVDDDSWFAYIACIDEGDDWQDERCWIKANPNLFVSVFLEDLRDGARRARRGSSALNNFLCKRLNRWTQQAERWIAVEDWDSCLEEFTEDQLQGRECFGGLDLAEKIDLNALCLIFPGADGENFQRAIWRFWMPAGRAQRLADEGDPKWLQWAKDGLIGLTEGDVTDYDVVHDDILEDSRCFSITQIGYDPWNATQLATKLNGEGVVMVEVRQNIGHLTEGSKEFEAKVLSTGIHHNGNRVMRHMVDNAAIERDKNGNIRPVKSKDRRKKIDGVVAAVIAESRLIVTPPRAYTRPFVRSV